MNRFILIINNDFLKGYCDYCLFQGKVVTEQTDICTATYHFVLAATVLFQLMFIWCSPVRSSHILSIVSHGKYIIQLLKMHLQNRDCLIAFYLLWMSQVLSWCNLKINKIKSVTAVIVSGTVIWRNKVHIGILMSWSASWFKTLNLSHSFSSTVQIFTAKSMVNFHRITLVKPFSTCEIWCQRQARWPLRNIAHSFRCLYGRLKSADCSLVWVISLCLSVICLRTQGTDNFVWPP